MLAERERPTAVLAANDLMALGVMAGLRAGGVQIPRDVSVIGFDDIAFAASAEPPLTTVCLPRVELGSRAVEALMAIIEHPERSGVQVNIPTYLITRASTAPASSPAQARARRAGGGSKPARAGGVKRRGHRSS